MIGTRSRRVDTWEDAVKVLGKNDVIMADRLNAILSRVDTVEKRFVKLKRITALGFIAAGVGMLTGWVAQDDICSRLDKCEKELRDKEDRVHYTGYGK